MPQLTTAYPNTATSVAIALGDGPWVNPNNAKANDGVNTTVSLSPLVFTERLTLSEFNLLSEDAGALVGTGGKITDNASIVGVRYLYEYSLSSGQSPEITLAGLGHSAAGVAQAMAVRSYGWGTLGAGSTVNVGNTWNGRNLSTDDGQIAARADLADPGLTLTIRGYNNTGLSNAQFAVDHLRIEIEWVQKKDGAGVGTAFNSGTRNVGTMNVTASQPGLGSSFGFGSALASAQVTLAVARSSASAFSSGIQKPIISMVGSTATTSTFVSAVGSVITTRSGIATASTFVGGGEAKAIANLRGVVPTTALATGEVKTTTGGQGIAVAYVFAQGGGAQSVVMESAATTTVAASGDQYSIATVSGSGATNAIATGVARAYSFAISGYVFDQDSFPIENVRVDVYRTNDHNHMGRVWTNVSGYFSLAIPSQPELFWTRSYLAGPPERFDTTGELLKLVESRVQGPPEE